MAAVANEQAWERVIDGLKQFGGGRRIAAVPVARTLAVIERIRGLPLPEKATPSLSLGTLLLGDGNSRVMVAWYDDGLFQVGYEEATDDLDVNPFTDLVVVPEADVVATVLRYWERLP